MRTRGDQIVELVSLPRIWRRVARRGAAALARRAEGRRAGSVREARALAHTVTLPSSEPRPFRDTIGAHAWITQL